MKRQAAITGPTPPMVLWTLLVDCPLRDLTRSPAATAASVQLRGLREWSRARSEGRIRNGICLHENCDSGAGNNTQQIQAEWLGFPEAEPFAVFGGQERVTEICGRCPANVASENGGVAGCWGVIPFASPDGEKETTELRLGTGQRLVVADLPTWFDRVLGNGNTRAEFRNLFPESSPAWYGIWIGEEWNRVQVEWMAGFLESNQSELPTRELHQFAAAAVSAHIHKLRLCYDRVPAGCADTVDWHLQPHCGRCGWLHNSRQPCPCCGETRAPMPEQRKKVMGLRPWLRMAQLYGPEASSRIVEEFQQTRGNHEPD